MGRKSPDASHSAWEDRPPDRGGGTKGVQSGGVRDLRGRGCNLQPRLRRYDNLQTGPAPLVHACAPGGGVHKTSQKSWARLPRLRPGFPPRPPLTRHYGPSHAPSRLSYPTSPPPPMQPHQALWPFWCGLTSKRTTPSPLRGVRLLGIGEVQAQREPPRGGWHEISWPIMAGIPSGGAPFRMDPHDHP